MVIRFLKRDDNDNLDKALSKTRLSVLGQIGNLFKSSGINEESLNDLEDILVASDLGLQTTEQIITLLRERGRTTTNTGSGDRSVSLLKEILTNILDIKSPNWDPISCDGPFVILMVGVNGAGKTTTIAKLSKRYIEMGKTVIAGAGDTFRAGASEQLKAWGKTLSIDVISHQQGADPGAVAFDTIAAALSRKVDVAIIDTAGRLQGNSNLMDELKKIYTVSAKSVDDSCLRVLLTIDATTGQNGLSQARSFGKAIPCDGVFLSKLDGSAKGGIVLPIVKDMRIPIAFVGTGEQLGDMAVFDAKSFVDSLMSIR
ncbi:MAG: signal recognition particle-docking protein FtsY [Chloroflexota bacterium]|nr:signal recognition particle-docking protein FtsY [Chloroflexota bacterium]